MVTKVFKVSDNLNHIILECAEILKKGGLVAFPTETVYGLGANPFNLFSVEKIFKVKGRPKDNPLIFHISSLAWVEKLAFLTNKEYEIIENFFPGPLTIVLKSKIDKAYTFGLSTIAIRMPDNFIALKLIEVSNFPIVAPSANLSGKPSPTQVSHVINDFSGKIDAIIDGGETVYGVESTVIDVTEYPYKVLRFGAIPIEEIMDKGFDLVLPDKKDLLKRSPGTRYRHYAPEAEVIVISDENELYNYLDLLDKKRCVYMGLNDVSRFVFFYKEIFKNEENYCKYLYSTFRYFDAIKVDVIFAELLPETGLGRTINDRLRKASLKK